MRAVNSTLRQSAQSSARIVPLFHKTQGRRVCQSILPFASVVHPRLGHSLHQLQRSVTTRVAVEDAVLAPEDAVLAPEDFKVTGTNPGSPSPLGPSKSDTGINFALYARHAKGVTLCIFDIKNKPISEHKLDPSMNKTDDIWHVLVEGLPGAGVCYGFKVDGEGGWENGLRWDKSRVLLDPYAPLVSSRRVFGQRDDIENFRGKDGSVFLGTFDFASEAFDWGSDYARPCLPQNDLVIYEMPVRSFTADPSSGLPEGVKGTFKGLQEKVPYLKSLGVTAVELLPVFEYDELEFQRFKNPRDHMVNVWGYSHLSFMAPMSRFASHGGGPAAAQREFKEMVKALHADGIEVILDVVYNHTNEGDDKDPYVTSFRGIDSKTYYMMTDQGYFVNWSGCGNTINANHPVTTKLIIDSLVQWVEEYHVDGFRFDLASALCRDERGNPIAAPPLIREISRHPVLSKVKLIAEPWDIGMFQVGSFPNWDVWSEWNGIYRDVLRKFIKGDAGMKSALATRLSGSSDLYQTNNRKPFHSVNFITAHDGFSMMDMFSYNSKRNGANGENNNDGTNDNFSWNCGAEGETNDGAIQAMRWRQMRNCMVALMMSQGTPMIVMGDEIGTTHCGNNNWYGHDARLAHMQWTGEEGDPAAMLRFTSLIIALRKEHPVLGQSEFLGKSNITWHEDNWGNEESRFLAFTLHDTTQAKGDLYVAFNAHSHPVTATLPGAPRGQKWCRVVDTNLPSPKDFTPGGNAGVDDKYTLQSYSSIVLIAK